jgi:hypothetical protein
MCRKVHFRVKDADNTNGPLVDAIKDHMLTSAMVAQARCQVVTNWTKLGM